MCFFSRSFFPLIFWKHPVLFSVMLLTCSQGLRAWPYGATYQGEWKDSLQHGKVRMSRFHSIRARYYPALSRSFGEGLLRTTGMVGQNQSTTSPSRATLCAGDSRLFGKRKLDGRKNPLYDSPSPSPPPPPPTLIVNLERTKRLGHVTAATSSLPSPRGLFNSPASVSHQTVG